MKSWQGLLTLLVCLLWTGGCKSPQGLDSLQRELRYQEDMIYELQNYIETYKSHLDECRRENQSCLTGSGNVEPRAPSGTPKIELSPGVEVPADALDSPQPPQIEIPGVEDQSRVEDPSRTDSSRSVILDNRVAQARHQDSVLVTSDVESDAEESAVAPTDYEVTDFVVTNIVLDEELTGGYDNDGQFGSDGIQIVLEARNADDDIVPPIGEISVAVLDQQATTAKEARVARWKFSPEQVALIAESMSAGEAVQLELPWQGEVPQQSELQVYLRMVTPEGERFIVNQAIDISEDQLVNLASTIEAVDDDEQPENSASSWKKRTGPRPAVVSRSEPIPKTQTRQPRQPRTFDQAESVAPMPRTRQATEPRRPKWSPYR